MVSTGFSQDVASLLLRTSETAATARMAAASDSVPAGVVPATSTGFASDEQSVNLLGAEADGTSRMPLTGVIKTNQEGGLVK